MPIAKTSGRVCMRDTPFDDDEILKFQILKTKKKPGAAPWYSALVAQRKKIPHGLFNVHGGPCDGYALDLCTEHGNAYTLPMNFLGDIGRYVNGAWQTLETAQEVIARRAAAHLAPAGAANDEEITHMEPLPKRTRRTRNAPEPHQAPPTAAREPEPYRPPESLLNAAERAQAAERASRPAPAEPDQAERARPFATVDATKNTAGGRMRLNAPAVCADWIAHQAQGGAVTRREARQTRQNAPEPHQAPPAMPGAPIAPNAHQAPPAVLWTAPAGAIPHRLRTQ